MTNNSSQVWIESALYSQGNPGTCEICKMRDKMGSQQNEMKKKVIRKHGKIFLKPHNKYKTLNK